MSPLIRLYPACYTGDLQSYKCWVSGSAPKFTVQKIKGGGREMVENNFFPKHKYIFV